ncbi:G-D-S-L family lipolytic protein [Elizabethkingia meningoseptica]|uniref:GDSL-type esterase/lipase family protein n=1 Tax=Elizabethkingia meningoseptica TaxID=238 RepID=UPI00099A6D9B|nr:GDSL-type esterase/lipase family protein [Elizabethkingia meningoseptica]EJK5327489.1 G-D-S-L family lipolytic protein [Elizabethkingia meningoseptica]OPC25653.1 G-D-S-L family lipolytic protein [Elizabethkingia meningoseptica]WBS74718.1 GDSL-type esterase/lipase family protein [Elizabethkingia meningoseptica]HAY3561861.1 G-D-S-L family lipolytic protein [Elizabethkingia meningoseptica]
MKKLRIIFAFVALLSITLQAQEKRMFWHDIQEFKKQDSLNGIAKDAILFIGSSTFTKWTDINQYFPEKIIINRGFGGSRLLDLNYFADDLLKPYHPKQIVIYCGDNDFVAEDKPSVDTVVARFKTFYGKVRQYYPNINVSYISIKHSPSRDEYWPQMQNANKQIKAFLKSQKNTSYIDITRSMNDKNGIIRKDIFLDDMLHMKPSGYIIWAKVIAPYLK